MKTSQFSFDLPQELIAQAPAPDREAARLMVLDRRTGELAHSTVRDLGRWIEPGTLMVLNDTRVRMARIHGTRASGAQTEILLLDRLGTDRWEAVVGRAGRLRSGTRLSFAEGVTALLESSEGEKRVLRFEPPIDDAWLNRNGHVPLPPYIRRPDEASDQERYQTVYAREPGSAAAPTAGLHLSSRLLEELRSSGIEVCGVTLHVGLGTFLPIRAEQIADHRMHEEAYTVPASTKAAVETARRQGRPILAVGTTVVRTLESAWTGEELAEGDGRTGIFITPGYRFRVVSQLLTNFHTPASTLLVLVCAFAGRERILHSYAVAIRERYRFFSYGDAMLIR